jgi:hypothetical protein
MQGASLGRVILLHSQRGSHNHPAQDVISVNHTVIVSVYPNGVILGEQRDFKPATMVACLPVSAYRVIRNKGRFLK